MAGSSADTRWCGTRSASRSNHQTDSAVSTRPLSGIGVGSTTSYAETRSLATTSEQVVARRVHVPDLAGGKVD